MDIKELAFVMYPYWILGSAMFLVTKASKYKDLVRAEKKAIFGFLKFLAFLTVYRVVLFKLFPNFEMFRNATKSISVIPTALTLTVGWEDCVHGLPLLLLRKFIGTKKWTWPIHGILTAAVMVEFGMGHVYQGLFSAILLSFYIPYSVRLGNKYGFGTVIIGHVLFDLTTIITMKAMLGN